MQVKAEIARPEEGETVPANKDVRVCGAAWTCDAEITKDELSTDRWRNVERRKIARRIELERVEIVGVRTGRHRRNRGNKLSSPALPIRAAERNHCIATPIAALT